MALPLNLQEAHQLIEENRKTKHPVLDLGDLYLFEVPEEVWTLTHLEVLNLGCSYYDEKAEEYVNTKNRFLPNCLMELPEGLNQLKELKALFINNIHSSWDEIISEKWQLLKDDKVGNRIHELKSFINLTLLATLDLSGNKIEKIENLDQLRNLSELNLRGNKIQKIENLESLQRLTKLSLSGSIQKIENLDQLHNLSELNLGGNNIEKIENLDQLHNLSELNLGGNNIEKIENLDQLHNLSELDLWGNNIEKIENLDRLHNLSRLNLWDNNIEKIENLDQLHNLSELDLWDNNIEKIENLDQLHNLSELDLWDNNIEKIENLDQLHNLSRLNLWDNNIEKIENLDRLHNLSTLNLFKNRIKKIENLDQLHNLSELNLGINEVQKIENLDQLHNLSELNLGGNKIQKIENLESLQRLIKLNLSGSIQKIENLDKLYNLSELNLGGNNIQKIENLDKLHNLSKLNLENNNIQKIENLDKLHNLSELNLGGNKIQKIENLDKLQSLLVLDVSANNFKKFTESTIINRLQILKAGFNLTPIAFNFNTINTQSLVSLQLEGTQIQNIPIEITNEENCIISLRNWLAGVGEGSEHNYEAKLIIAGNGRVGKTSILRRFFDNRFDPEEKSTHGIQLFKGNFEGENQEVEKVPLTINAWDFGGQEIYHATHRLFMQSRALYLVVWDQETAQKPTATEIIENREEEFPNYSLPYWLHNARSTSYNSPLFAVQNKVDLLEKPYPLPKNAEALQEEFRIIDYINTSPVRERLFRSLRQAILDEIMEMPEVGMRVPSKWMRIRDHLVGLKDDGQKTLAYTEFEAFCKERGINHSAAQTLINYLHNTGQVFYQPGLFHDEIVIDQKWALDGVYILFTRDWVFEMLKNARGKINLRALQGPWQAYSTEDRKVFLSLMESCEICFKIEEIPENDTYLLPYYLPVEKPKEVEEDWKETQDRELYLQYIHPYFHSALMIRFINKAGRLSTGLNGMWKYGIAIKHEGTEALVEAFPTLNEPYRILVRARGKDPVDMLRRIHNSFKEIYYEDEKVTITVGYGEDKMVNYQLLKDQKEEAQISAVDGRVVDTNPHKIFIKIIEPDKHEEERKPAHSSELDAKQQSVPQEPKTLEEIVPPPQKHDKGVNIFLNVNNQHDMGDQYNFDNSQAGAVGKNASASGNTFNQQNNLPANLDFTQLATELDQLKQALKQQAESPEEFSAIAEVASAEEAAKNKEGNKVVKHLKSAGKFALDTAQKIGVSLAAEVIQKQMGM